TATCSWACSRRCAPCATTWRSSRCRRRSRPRPSRRSSGVPRPRPSSTCRRRCTRSKSVTRRLPHRASISAARRGSSSTTWRGGPWGGSCDHRVRGTPRAHAASSHAARLFAPSARDVGGLVARLGPLAPDAEVLPLHGRLSSAAQDRATAGRRDGDARRIVVSTALAESSLTVPGVRLVVDAGLSREVRRDRARDMTGLVTVSASRASADQRAGRAARQGPGTVVRAYSEADYAAFRRAAEPEIASADLVDAMLLLAAWGTPGGSALPLPTAPPPKASERAQAALRAMGLVDAGGRITDEGARVARLPIGAREARALRSAAAAGIPRAATAEIVAALAGDHRAPDA